MVKTESLSYKYVRYNQQSDEKEYVEALNNISIDIGKGEFVAVLGRNGSGKSTFAKHINVLLTPSSGKVFVNGHDTSLENNIWLIRQQAGMVFQNPDNQIIATIVEEDVAFGPENLGVNPEEIRERVNASLKAVSMEEFKRKAPNLLSGGQKQRVAIAGVLAMRPDLIVFDEATAMLDPIGRKEVMEIIRRLNKEEGITIIHITHFMEEAAQAERVIVIDNGAVVMDGKPQSIFQNVEGLKAIGLDVPQVTEISNILRKKGISLPEDIITVEGMVKALSKFKINSPSLLNSENSGGKEDRTKAEPKNDNYIQIENLTYIYSPDTVFKQTAVDDISFSIGKGEFFGIIGHTGSGKSTLIQHFNALLKPTSGRIIIDGMDINADKSKLKSVRAKVGLVFQYPENQLFETTVFEDVAFGPKNAGLSEEEIKERVIKALALVGLSSEFHNKSPFELSGGQKRRAAIAGVLAMEPEVLVMDEPTAGLDPMGRDEIFENIKYLHEQLGNTIIIVSHSMEDIARLTDRLAVIAEGKLKYLGTPKEVFRHGAELEEIGLSVPQTSYLIKALNARGFSLDEDIYTAAEAAEAIYSSIKMQSVERLALK